MEKELNKLQNEQLEDVSGGIALFEADGKAAFLGKNVPGKNMPNMSAECHEKDAKGKNAAARAKASSSQQEKLLPPIAATLRNTNKNK